ncbi:hypothetical protein Poly41_69080 [Novipirellula artificiosorum]|uniref:Uncharacterized protein n=1 Tax=Novipirellula artificiosorum TaxID=2528016 RepID=A0A5C6D0P2_9BACT|nr:hypothetical protein Poly41_69080 [Novipirellula artificiosorum]
MISRSTLQVAVDSFQIVTSGLCDRDGEIGNVQLLDLRSNITLSVARAVFILASPDSILWGVTSVVAWATPVPKANGVPADSNLKKYQNCGRK